MSDRVDRDVINALISGHFADPFSVLGCTERKQGWKSGRYCLTRPTFG